MSKEILVLGDMHAGSKYGVSTIAGNRVQVALGLLWDGMLNEISERHIDSIITMGDMVDGTNYKSGGKGLDTANIMEQVATARELLDTLPQVPMYSVTGSPYHSATNAGGDEILAAQMGATFGDELLINFGDGVRIHASHKIGVSGAGTQYRTTSIAQQMMLATLNEDAYGKFDAIIRGHAHYFVEVRFGTQVGLICPSWKGRDEFAQQRSLGMVPHIGYLILKIKKGVVSVEPHVTNLSGDDLIEEVIA